MPFNKIYTYNVNQVTFSFYEFLDSDFVSEFKFIIENNEFIKNLSVGSVNFIQNFELVSPFVSRIKFTNANLFTFNILEDPEVPEIPDFSIFVNDEQGNEAARIEGFIDVSPGTTVTIELEIPGVTGKILRVNEVKTDFQNVFTNNNINFAGETFEDYPSVLADKLAEPLVIKDSNEDIFTRKTILETDDPDFVDYNVSGWDFNSNISSTNFYAEDALMQYGKRFVTGASYGGSINSIAVRPDNSVFAGGVSTRRVRRFTRFNLEFTGDSGLFPATIDKILYFDNLDKIYAQDAASNFAILTIPIFGSIPTIESTTSLSPSLEDAAIDPVTNNLLVLRDSEVLAYDVTGSTPNLIGSLSTAGAEKNIVISGSEFYIIRTDGVLLRYAFNFDGGTFNTTLEQTTTDIYDSTVDGMVATSNRIYITGLIGTRIIDATDHTLIAVAPAYGARPRAIEATETHFYVAGEANDVKKYRADTLELVGVTEDYGGTIRTVVFKNDRIYYGGIGLQRPIKILDMHGFIGEVV